MTGSRTYSGETRSAEMLVVWYMNGTTLISGAMIYQGVPLYWEIVRHRGFQ